MRDLELILHGVVDASTRALVAEAIQAFNGGARRSAVVSLWIAVSSDLVGKMRALAEGGDKKAQERVAKLDRAIEARDVRSFLDLEGTVLAAAEEDYELISHHERVSLQRLYEDRNLCAHPSFNPDEQLFDPSSEAFRAHLVEASDAVLGRHAVAGKRRLNRLTAEIQGDSWPTPISNDYLEARFFDRAADSVRSNMTKVLIKSSIIPPSDVPAANRVAQRARSAVLVRREADPWLHAEALRTVLNSWDQSGALNDEALVRVAGAYASTSEFVSLLPPSVYVKIDTLLERVGTEFLVDHRFFVVGRPADAGLAKRYDARLSELDIAEVRRVIDQTHNRGILVDRVIELIREASSFSDAASSVRLLVDVAGALTRERVEALRAAILENEGDQVRPARGVESALIDVYEVGFWDVEAQASWVELAQMLVDTTDADHYYGAFVDKPYGRLLDVVAGERETEIDGEP